MATRTAYLEWTPVPTIAITLPLELPPPDGFAPDDLVEVEFFSALANKVRTREMSTADATRTGEQFLDHLHGGLYVRIAVQRRHYETARGWLARFTLPLRALDALHLALVDREGLRLATSDYDLSRSAKSLGVAVTLVRRERRG